jgi:DNA (cytosine-5)-methyltransferase 1
MKVLDLFSGIGGFSLGLERSGMETVAFCEIEPFPRKVLAKHWPNVPIYEDVRNVTRERLEADGITGISVVTGGFPCQDLSGSGQQKGINAERSGLYKENIRIIGELRPEYALFENVTDLLTGDRGRWFAQFLYDLASIGYDAEWHCIPASELGTSHHRDRVWIIAYPYGTNVQGFNFPQPLFPHTEESRRWELTRAIDAFMEADDYIEWRGTYDAISEEMDRLKGLGNAVVPQIPEIIGRAIMDIENG